MADRTLTVHIIGDDESLRRAFARSQKSTQQFQGQMTGLAKNVKTAFAAAGFTIGASVIAGQLREATDAASNLNEQIAKSEQVFGDASGGVIAWSRETASAFGISQRAALEASGTFGNLFRTVELAPAKAAEMSRSLVQLAADLASFNNASPEEVLLALRSGLIGEAEPLRRFGVLLSETRVQQEAMAETGKKNVKALTDQDKALARYQIILRDTAPAQGDFARTSEGLANQSRILKAETEDLAASFGQILIPAVTGAVQVLNSLVGGTNDAIVATQNFKKALRDTDAFSGWNDAVGDASSSVGGFLTRIRDGIPLLGDFREAVIDAFDETPEDRLPTPGARGPRPSPDTQDAAAAARKRMADDKRELRRASRDFDSFIKGLGLKLDKARITAGLDDDLAVLREIEGAIQRQIRREGKTFELVERLTQVRAQIATTSAQRAREAGDRASDAFEDVLGALELDVERARDTPRLEDDLRALRKVEARIKARIASEGRTLELQRRLLDVQREINDVLRQQREAREERARQEAEARQGRQFRALGLTAEGEERTPTARQLRRRSLALEDRIKGTILDTEKTRATLDRIQKVLSGKFGKVGKEVRAAILQMLNDIASAFKDGDKAVANASGEITAGGIKSLKELTEGLGLTQEQLEEMGRRQMGVQRRDRRGAFGFAVDGPRTSSTLGKDRGTEPDITIHNHIVIDGKDVATSVNRVNQKNGRRRSGSRSGRAGGRPAGI